MPTLRKLCLLLLYCMIENMKLFMHHYHLELFDGTNYPLIELSKHQPSCRPAGAALGLIPSMVLELRIHRELPSWLVSYIYGSDPGLVIPNIDKCDPPCEKQS